MFDVGIDMLDVFALNEMNIEEALDEEIASEVLEEGGDAVAQLE